MNLNELSATQRRELAEVLDSFGLKDKEQKMYLTLLESGSSTVTPLARVLKFPVTTVQSVLNRLVKIGLAAITLRKSRQVYEANDPSVLKKILERKVAEVSDIIPILKNLKNETGVAPKIRVYFRERVADILHEALRCKSKLIYEIVSAKDFQEIIGEKFHFTKRRVEAGIHLKSLRVEQFEIKKYSAKTHGRELREAKFLPREMSFQSSVMFWDNTVAFFSTKDEGVAWLTESAMIKTMFFQIFEMLWSVSRKMETAVE